MADTVSFLLGISLVAGAPILLLVVIVYGAKTCPYCRARIPRKAVVCSHCCRDVPARPVKAR
jgi:hypothetical protein